MCVYSMVLDHYKNPFKPYIYPDTTGPNTIPWTPTVTTPPPPQIVNIQQLPFKEIEDLKSLIKEFKEALEAAKVVDKLTKQPDCEDPEKAKLVERVNALERLLGVQA
jgi:hypothetical protein